MAQISRLQSLDTDQVREALTQDVDVGKKPFLRWDGLHWLLHNQHGEPSAIVSAYTVADLKDAGEIEERPGPIEPTIIWVAKEKPKPVTHSPEPWDQDTHHQVDESAELGAYVCMGLVDYAHVIACVNALAGINPDAIKPLLKAARAVERRHLAALQGRPAVPSICTLMTNLNVALELADKVKP